MKNYILFFISIILLSSCEKNFDSTYFPNSYALFSKKDISKKQLSANNQKLLDSLMKYADTTAFMQNLYYHNEDFLTKPEVDNKIQKQELLYWQSCIDSIYKNIQDENLIHYLYLAHQVKPITKRDLKKRAKIYASNENKNFDLAIFFSDDSIYDCFAEYLPKVNLIVIYDYKNTVKYGAKDQCLGRSLLLFHELFHADKISREEFNVLRQHILINFYEKEIVQSQPQIRDYVEELLSCNLDFLANQVFVRGTYLNYGDLAMTTVQNYSYDCLYKKAIINVK